MRFLTLLFLAGGVGAILWMSWSCKDQVTGPDLGQVVFPDSNISYRGQVQPLFDRGCGGQNNACHGPETIADHQYALDNYNDATHRVGIIVRGNPDGSLLNQTIEKKVSPAMPPANAPQLTQNQITGMRKWVAEGARGDN